MAWRARHLEKGGYRSGAVESSLQGCSFSTLGKKHSFTQQEEGGVAEDRVVVKPKTLGGGELSVTMRKKLDQEQADMCRKLILGFSGV